MSVDELKNAIKAMGADVQDQDILDVMLEADHNRNGTLDIDEFINLFTLGDRIKFTPKSRATYDKIQNARRLSPADFFKAFKSMPSNFVPSFTGAEWR